MTKYCCICERLIDDEDDYNRVGQDYYCLHCSNNDLVPCPVCETMLNPDTDTAFSSSDGCLFCSQNCLNVDTEIRRTYKEEVGYNGEG